MCSESRATTTKKEIVRDGWRWVGYRVCVCLCRAVVVLCPSILSFLSTWYNVRTQEPKDVRRRYGVTTRWGGLLSNAGGRGFPTDLRLGGGF